MKIAQEREDVEKNLFGKRINVELSLWGSLLWEEVVQECDVLGDMSFVKARSQRVLCLPLHLFYFAKQNFFLEKKTRTFSGRRTRVLEGIVVLK